MKTLNEVINALECCKSDNPCNDKCPYARDECRSYALETDALFYLKEYRDVTEKCASALAERYPDQNDPLSWDELKTMLGKPVWVEGKTKFWAIIGRIAWNDLGEGLINFIRKGASGMHTQQYKAKMIGTSWNAYRKER